MANSQNLRPWKKGQSGNPSGRPKKRPMSDRYAAIVEVVLPENIRKKLKLPVGSTYGDALAIGQALSGIDGDARSAREVREGIEGKATTRIELSGPGGQNVEFTHTVTQETKTLFLAEIRRIYGISTAADPSPSPDAADPAGTLPLPGKVVRRRKPKKVRRKK